MSYHLSETVTRIGRETDNDIVLPNDNRVSRYHAEIRREGGEHVLRDVNSRNGTRVNGRRATRHTLMDGDRIGIGESELPYHNGSLSLPAGAVVGRARAAGGTPPSPPSPRSGTTMALLGAAALLLLVVLALVFLLRGRSGAGAATPTPLPSFDTAERVARQWIQSNLSSVTDDITDSAHPQLPPGTIERPVLRDNVRKYVGRDSDWKTKTTLEDEVTEGVFRVSAVITFPAGLVNPPDYSITATYLITVDTRDRTVEEHILQTPVVVVEAQ